MLYKGYIIYLISVYHVNIQFMAYIIYRIFLNLVFYKVFLTAIIKNCLQECTSCKNTVCRNITEEPLIKCYINNKMAS